MAEETNPTTGVTITTGNEIGRDGKVIAGILFILFTLLTILMLIAYWPDRLPKSDNAAVYRNDLFNVCLIDSLNQCDICPSASHPTTKDSLLINALVARLVNDTTGLDSTAFVARVQDSVRTSDSLFKVYTTSSLSNTCCTNTIRLNTLLLILVTLAGFLGTMIHVASSFTNYVGAEKFKKSWKLWYIVKPFTGAGLALILYFIFRAGLLNFNDTSNINLYGIITLAALAGLFTDKATLKLEEIFSVVFRPKDERPDKLDKDEVNVKITGIKPGSLLGNIDNNLIISGEGLDKKKFVIKIDEEEIKNPVIKGDSISFTYKLPTDLDKNEFTLRVYDESGKEVYSSKLLKGEQQPQAPKPTDETSTSTEDSTDENREEFGDADAEDELNKPQD